MDYFDYASESGTNDWGFDIDEFLDRSREAEQQQLENQLQRIEELLEQRETVHTEMVEELESKLEWYLDRLKQLYKRQSLKDERAALKDRIQEFYRELRMEKRRNWQDRQQLEQDRRDILAQLDELDADDLFEDLV